MVQLHRTASIKWLLALIASLLAAAADASLLDCAPSKGEEQALYVDCNQMQMLPVHDQIRRARETTSVHPTNVVYGGFQVDPTRTPGTAPNSAPLLVLTAFLITALLVRAKSHNSK